MVRMEGRRRRTRRRPGWSGPDSRPKGFCHQADVTHTPPHHYPPYARVCVPRPRVELGLSKNLPDLVESLVLFPWTILITSTRSRDVCRFGVAVPPLHIKGKKRSVRGPEGGLVRNSKRETKGCFFLRSVVDQELEPVCNHSRPISYLSRPSEISQVLD